MAKREASTNTDGHFLTNKTLLEEVIACKANNNITSDALAKMLVMMVHKYSKRPNFHYYSYLDEMCAAAIAHLIGVWHKFDETKYNKPFAYYTSCIHNIFLQQIEAEKHQKRIIDDLMILSGHNVLGFDDPKE